MKKLLGICAVVAVAMSVAPHAQKPGGGAVSSFYDLKTKTLLGHLSAAVGSFAIAIAISAVFVTAIVLTTQVHFADILVAFAPGAMDAMLALALTLHIDPVFVGAHHLARVFTVTLALPLIVRALAPAKRTRSGRPVRPKDGEFSD